MLKYSKILIGNYRHTKNKKVFIWKTKYGITEQKET